MSVSVLVCLSVRVLVCLPASGLVCLYVSVLVCICLAALNSSDHAVRAERTPDETRLYRELMADYENSIRPILNASNTLVIDFELTLTQITDLVSAQTTTSRLGR